MNTYLIPVTETYGYKECYLAAIHETSSENAYEFAKHTIHDRSVIKQDEYEYYEEELSIHPTIFHISKKDVIMTEALMESKRYRHMAFFRVNWNNYTEALSKKAIPENWSNLTYPNNGILANYIVKTYAKLTSERKIIIQNDYALFNTGLYTKYYDPIFAYQSGSDIQFLTGYELGGIGVNERPERADYFKNPELLLFDWHYKIDVHYPHILEDKNNLERMPKTIRESKNISTTLDGAIEKMKRKVSANYKLAIPQYFEDKIQLLLPLCLEDDNIPDLALVVTKTGNYYRGHTCLTLDMAYNNARLIAKPESSWLTI